MAAPNLKSKEEIAINTKKQDLMKIDRELTAFAANFNSLKIHERAKLYQEIIKELRIVHQFIITIKSEPNFSTSTKFAYENLKSSYSSINAKFKRFESKYMGL